MASVAKVAQPQGRRRGPARRPRPQAAQPAAGQLPARAAPVRARGRAGRGGRGRGAGAHPAAARRADHPPGHPDLRHARARLPARCWWRRGSTPRTPGAPRRIINSHPGVSHNYLRNHDFNLWFTIATEPDSRLGLEGTLDVLAGAHRRRVGAPAAHAPPVQDPHGPGDGGRHRGARQRRAWPRTPRSRRPIELSDLDVAVIRALQGDMPVVPEPYAPAAAELGIDAGARCSSTSSR